MPKTALNESELRAKQAAKTYSDLGIVAIKHIERAIAEFPQLPVIEICGPITSDGNNLVSTNLEVFRSWIDRIAKSRKWMVFDQLSFEFDLFRLREEIGTDPLSSRLALLNDFYLPIFESGMIETLCFIPSWSRSSGSLWEHQQATRLKIPIEYL